MVAGSYCPYGGFTPYRPPRGGFFIPPAMRVVADSVNASSACESIGVDIGISQIGHEMDLYLRSTMIQMSRTLTGNTQSWWGFICRVTARLRTITWGRC